MPVLQVVAGGDPVSGVRLQHVEGVEDGDLRPDLEEGADACRVTELDAHGHLAGEGRQTPGVAASVENLEASTISPAVMSLVATSLALSASHLGQGVVRNALLRDGLLDR